MERTKQLLKRAICLLGMIERETENIESINVINPDAKRFAFDDKPAALKRARITRLKDIMAFNMTLDELNNFRIVIAPEEYVEALESSGHSNQLNPKTK